MRGSLKAYAAFLDKIGSNRFDMTLDIGHIRDADGVNPLKCQFLGQGRNFQK
jgi:hypothetical protein